MKIRVYTIGKKTLIGEYRVHEVYERTFYHRNMPVLSQSRCRQILNEVCPNGKLHSKLLVIEDCKTGYTGLQVIHRKGTILNF